MKNKDQFLLHFKKWREVSNNKTCQNKLIITEYINTISELKLCTQSTGHLSPLSEKPSLDTKYLHKNKGAKPTHFTAGNFY